MEPRRGPRIPRGIAARAFAPCAALILAAGTASGAAAPPHHRLALQLDPEGNRLSGRDRIRWQGSGRLRFTLHPALAVDRVTVDGRAYPVARGEAPGQWRGRRALAAGRHRVVIRYGGRIPPGEGREGFRDVLKGFPPRITPGGTYLPAGAAWAPNLDAARLTYRLRVTLPTGQKVAAAGRRGTEAVAGKRRRVTFTYDRPIPGITLLAGPYRRQQGPGSGPIPTAALLHPELAGLGPKYLKAAEDYLARFQDRYGDYPHFRFSLVSSPWPTGFGFPGLAYIGRRILPLPFIPRTSLPHEVLHNWWGNGVFVAPGSGNWAEGLTTFGADYRLAAERSEAAARKLRRRWLADFASYFGDREAPSLRGFRARVDGASRTLGYNKAAFVWIMLRQRLGGETFRSGLRRFYAEHRRRQATWTDLRRAFEAVSERDLEWFFGQWLDRAGAPQPELVGVRREPGAAVLTLAHPEPAYRLALPIRLTFADGDTAVHTVRLGTTRQTVRLDTGDDQPVGVRVDPDFRVFRRLAPEAVPPRLAAVLAREEAGTIVIHPELATPAGNRAARRVGRALWDAEPEVVTGDDQAQPAPGSVRVVPLPALPRHWRALGAADELPEWPPGADARIALGRSHPGAAPFLLVAVADPEALAALARPLPHYGSYGWLAFRGGERLARGRWPVTEPALTWRAPGNGPPGED